MTAITTAQLTEATIEGTGIFDVLMRANKAHLDQEFEKQRIRGPEYSQVYLGMLTQAMSISIQFLLQKEKADLEAELVRKQIDLTQGEITKAEAQTALLVQQKLNAQDELLTSAKQREKLDQDILSAQQMVLKITADVAVAEQQKLNMIDELLTAAKQREKLTQDTLNAETENTVIIAQECKLRAEFDLAVAAKLKTEQETLLLSQKTATEKAQVSSIGVDTDSIVGRQKNLYNAQTNGYQRDAEQKAAKIMVDSWNVRRTTDDATSGNTTNRLDDNNVGDAVVRLLAGIGITQP